MKKTVLVDSIWFIKKYYLCVYSNDFTRGSMTASFILVCHQVICILCEYALGDHCKMHNIVNASDAVCKWLLKYENPAFFIDAPPYAYRLINI